MARLPKADAVDQRAAVLIERYAAQAKPYEGNPGYVAVRLARIDGQELLMMAQGVPSHIRHIVNGIDKRTVYYGRCKSATTSYRNWTLVPANGDYDLLWFAGVQRTPVYEELDPVESFHTREQWVMAAEENWVDLQGNHVKLMRGETVDHEYDEEQA